MRALRALLGLRENGAARTARLLRDLAKLYVLEAKEKGVRGPGGAIKPDPYLMLCAKDIYRRMKALEVPR